MAIYCVDPMTCVGAPGEVHLTQMNPPGTVRLFSDGNEYVYLKGAASTVLGDTVVWNHLGATSRSTTTTFGPVAIATAAVLANQWGWYGFSGVFTPNTVTVVTDVLVYATATPGVLDDTVVATAKLTGAMFRSGGTSSATMQIGPGGAFLG